MHADAPIALCVGEILFDAIETHDALGRSTGPPRLLAGGAPANTAVALRRLGVASAFIGCIAKDAAGDDLFSLLDAADVDVRGVQRTHAAPTRVVRVACDALGERTFLDFGGTPAEAFADAYLQAPATPSELLANVALVVVGSLSQAYTQSREAIGQILSEARERGIPVFVDVNRRPMFWPHVEALREQETTRALLTRASYVKASVEEAQFLFQTAQPEEIANIAPWLRAGVVVTDGPREIRYSIKGASGTLKPPRILSVDTTGAGDAFTAGWIARILASDATDASAVDTIRYAAAVGALATTGVGAWGALPTHEEVAAFLNA